MTYEVVKTYVVAADTEEKAKEILTKCEEKNLQGLFLQTAVVTLVKSEQRNSIWPKLW